MSSTFGRILKSNEFQYGICLLAFGVAGLYLAAPLRLGTAMRMGPGFVPTGLAWLLVGMSLIYIVRGVFTVEEESPPWGWRPLAIVLGSIAFFTLAIDRLGLPLAIIGLTLISAAAERGRKWWPESLVLAVGMALFCTLLFVFVLGLSIPLLPSALR